MRGIEAAKEQAERHRQAFAAHWGLDDVGQAEPFVRGLAPDYLFTVEEEGGVACVVVEFSHDSRPGLRFKHRFPPPEWWEDEDYGDVHFMESVDTGKLPRAAAADGASPVWTGFGHHG